MSNSRSACLNGTSILRTLALVACVASPAMPAETPDDLKAKVVEVDLSDFDREDPAPAMPFGGSPRNFLGELKRLRAIAADPEVKGIRLRPQNGLDDARTLDVVKELRAVKTAGKKVLCYAESLDRDSLVFASLADLLVVPPSGMVELQAPSAELLYLKGLLDKAGVRFDVLHVGEFKTAFEDLSRDSMSAEQRESLTDLLRERYEQCVELIANHRKIDRAAVEQGFEAIWLEPERAKELGLVDHVAYQDGFDAKAAELLGGKPELDKEYGDASKDELEAMLDNPFAVFSMLKDALDEGKDELPAGAKIAIVYCSGPINSGKSMSGFGGDAMGSETIVAALEEARKNDDVKAVVLRVNSPGGSALASDMIWRAVQRVREKKPVVASMGGVAASGGYWISMGCDKIVAQPSTITGSIGVVSAAPDLSDAFEKVGVSVQVVGYGPHAEELAILKDGLSPLMKDKIQAMMQRVYGEFIAKASSGRKLDPAQLEPNARGRVWTGRKARDLGLVDGFGGLQEAITMACHLGGRLDAHTTPVLELPEPPGLFDAIEQALEGMVSVRGVFEKVVAEAGVAEALPWLRLLFDSERTSSSPRILCVMPECLRMR